MPHAVPNKTGSGAEARHSLRDVLAHRLTRYTPTVLLDPLDDRAVILDLTGLSHLWSSELALVSEILADCDDLGTPPVRIAFGDTIGMATIFTRGAALRAQDAALPQRLSWVYWIPAGQGIPFLRRYPIAALGFRQEIVDCCRELGIRTVADFMEIPADAIAARFGRDTWRRWEEITGRRTEILPPWQPPEENSVTQCLEYPCTSPEALAFCLQRAVELLLLQTATGDRGITRLAVTVHCEGGGKVEDSLAFFTPASDPQRILEVLHLRLERCHLPGAVWGVRVTAAETAPLLTRQGWLFEGLREERRTLRWGRLVERLAARLGEERVLQPVLRAEYQPELAWEGFPIFSARKRSPFRATALPDLGPRPTRLYGRPIPVAVMAAHPDGPPYRCFHGGKWFAVVRAWGPERIETGWWRGRTTARDYYRTEWEDGSHLWLYRRLQDGRWFLHGSFG